MYWVRPCVPKYFFHKLMKTVTVIIHNPTVHQFFPYSALGCNELVHSECPDLADGNVNAVGGGVMWLRSVQMQFCGK